MTEMFDMKGTLAAHAKLEQRCPYFRARLPHPHCGLIDIERGERTRIRVSDCEGCLAKGGPASEESKVYRLSIMGSVEKAEDMLRGAAPCSKCVGVREMHKREDAGTFARLVSVASDQGIVLTHNGAWRGGEQLTIRSSDELLELLGLTEDTFNRLRFSPPVPIGPLTEVFARVCVISLARRTDRLGRFLRMTESNWPFKAPQVVPAIDGNLVIPPETWKAGGPAWGCARSHAGILERCLADGIESVLILEDDAMVWPGFEEACAKFLAAVPGDWEILMFGGQNSPGAVSPVPGQPGVVRTKECGRTHAYGARGRPAMVALYHKYVSGTQHIDWHMGAVHRRHRTYAPVPFLVAQAGGPSDISGRVEPDRSWNR